MLAIAGFAAWWYLLPTHRPVHGRAATPLAWPAYRQALLGPGAPQAPGLQDPFGLALDAQGTLYLSDGGDANTLYRLGADGVLSVLAGGPREGLADGLGAAAAFHTPSGLAVDRLGNVYVADTGNHAIRKVTPQGQVSTVAGNGQPGWRDGPGAQAQFNGPMGVAVDEATGKLYVADSYNDRLRVIDAAGNVSTLAGGERPGWQDGPGAQARFDTPTLLLALPGGALLVADSGNLALRKLDASGNVSTLWRADPEDGAALLRRPMGLAVAHDGVIYASDGASGRVVQLTPGGQVLALPDAAQPPAATTSAALAAAMPAAPASTVSPSSASPAAVPATPAASGVPGTPDRPALRLMRPAGIVLDAAGRLVVAEQASHTVWRLSALPASPAAAPASSASSPAPAASAVAAPQAPADAGGTRKAPMPVGAGHSFPWPTRPQWAWHEVVGVVGEVRGNFDGESRHHLHAGLDVQADVGETVLAVARGKVTLALPNWGYNELSEGLNVGPLAYVHMRVGRTPAARLLDPARFALANGDDGKPERVRVRRGTRFEVGDALGTVNRMAHVHLEHSPQGWVENLLALPFADMQDTVPPRILGIALYDTSGERLAGKEAEGRPPAPPKDKPRLRAPRTKQGKLPLPRTDRHSLRIPRSVGPLAIVVDALDQVDGNLPRRRLGLYKLGYQVLRADGTPMPGYEQPRVTLEFNRLPREREAVKLLYWADSGITVHGAAATRFRYTVTNTLHNGQAAPGSWNPADLPPGDYRIRVLASDFAGNPAIAGRDLAITIE